MTKKPEMHEDTVKIMLDRSRQTLAEVSALIERGRSKTGDSRAIDVLGPWSIGNLFHSEDLVVRIYVSHSARLDAPLSKVTSPSRIFYIGKRGVSIIHRTTGYMRITEGNVIVVNPGEEHYVEPAEVGAQIIVITFGGTP